MCKLLMPCLVALLVICVAAISIAQSIGSTLSSSEIAYLTSTSIDQLYLTDVYHGLSYRVSNALVSYGYFAWSSDGKQFVFASDIVVSTEIFIAGVDGHSLRQITVDTDREVYPAWAPDSQHIAFTRHSMNTQTPDIYIMNVEDRSERMLTQDAVLETNLVWSPDGTQIAYIAFDTASNRIRVIDAQTGELRGELNEISGNFDHLSWSPDGTRLIFTVYNISTTIYVMEITSHRIAALTSFDQNNYLPAWSPDGTQIAFVSERDRNSEVYVMNADGTNQRRLTFSPLSDMFPSWSPDGGRIAFASTGSTATSDIYVMNADGSNPQRLTTSTDFNEWLPRWRP